MTQSPQDAIRTYLRETNVEAVMSKPAITVKDDDAFSTVLEKLESHSIRHLPVVDREGKLVGLITQRDVFKIHSPRRLESGEWYYDKEAMDNFILKNVMNKKPFTMKSSQSLAEALSIMAEFKYGCIPVVDGVNRPIGILTQIDILKIAARIIQFK